MPEHEYSNYRRLVLRGEIGTNVLVDTATGVKIEGLVLPHTVLVETKYGGMYGREGNVVIRLNGTKIAVLAPEDFDLLFQFRDQ